MAENVPLGCDADEAECQLAFISRRWGELGERCELVLRSHGEHVSDLHARFPPTRDGIRRAAEWAADLAAKEGRNVYPVVNPLRPGGGAGRDEDVIASFFHWADADTPEAVDKLQSWGGPKWRMVVKTGGTPSTRVHVYWELREPTRDLKAWRATQQAIAAQFSSDRSVINPSRIMKLAGTISWPNQRKRERGYIPELATLKVFEDRDMVDAEAFGRAFRQAEMTPPSEGFAFDTNQTEIRDVTDYLDMLRRAQTDGEKHRAAVELAASLAGQGVNERFATALIWHHIPPHGRDDNLLNTIRSGYEKFYRAPQGNHHQAFDFKPEGAERSGEGNQTWRVQSAADFIADFVAPEYLVDGVIQRGRLYTLTAPTGSGKTAAMLYASTAIAQGWDFCGRDTEQGAVLFLAGENPDDVRARVIATLDHYEINASDCPVYVIAGTFSIRADMERLESAAAEIGDVALIVVDTFAAYFDGDDENSNAQALDFARVVRRLTGLPSRPAVVMPAHPVKNAARTNLTPKGGSSLLNEVDGNLTLWNDDGRVKLHWQGKHRGPDFDPLMIEMRRVENAKIHDRHGRIMPSVVAVPITEMRATEIAAETFSFEDQLLIQIKHDPALSVAERCARLGLMTGTGKAHKSKLQRTLMNLREQKLIRNFRGRWELTKDGERAVELIESGAPKAADGGE